jgi:monofunctional biosynthetic peptidoglycan transglycosylase
LPEGIFAAGSLAYDMMYGQGQTPFLVFARSQGAARLADGLGMLVEQAAEAFRSGAGPPRHGAGDGHAARAEPPLRRAMSVTRWLKRLLLGCIALLLLYQFWLFGWVLWWNWVNPDSTRFMSIRLAELQDQGSAGATEKAMGRLRPHLGQPEARDHRRRRRQVRRSRGLRLGRHPARNREEPEGRGASSPAARRSRSNSPRISFLTPAKTTWRKAEEAIITLMLETVWSKQRIFEVYLNVIEWGNGVFGAEAAARSLLRRFCRTADARAGRATGGHGPQPALLRPQPQRTGLARKTAIILARMRSADLP